MVHRNDPLFRIKDFKDRQNTISRGSLVKIVSRAEDRIVES